MMDTNTVIQTTNFTMDTNIMAALISAGVSIAFSISYWLIGSIKSWVKYEITFKTYKNYVKEILQDIIHYYDTNEIICRLDPKNQKKYKLAQLIFILIKEDGNEEKDVLNENIINLFVSFIEKRDLLDDKEVKTLIKILRRMSHDSWLYLAKHVDDNNNKIKCTTIAITEKEDCPILSSIYPEEFLNIIPKYNNKKFFEEILGLLKKGCFNKRIRKIIKRELG